MMLPAESAAWRRTSSQTGLRFVFKQNPRMVPMMRQQQRRRRSERRHAWPRTKLLVAASKPQESEEEAKRAKRAKNILGSGATVAKAATVEV